MFVNSFFKKILKIFNFFLEILKTHKAFETGT